MSYTTFRHRRKTLGPGTVYGAAHARPDLQATVRLPTYLVRVVGDAELLREVDLDQLEKLPADYVGDSGQQRRGDTVWRVSYRGGSLYLLILLEFQSTSDSLMALRNLEYTTLLYRELERRAELGAPGSWPPVLPVVLYNGETRWTAELEMRELIAPVPGLLAPCQPSQRSLLFDERRVAVDDLPLGNLVRALAGFEQSRSPTELAQVAVSGQRLATRTIGARSGRRFRGLDASDCGADGPGGRTRTFGP